MVETSNKYITCYVKNGKVVEQYFLDFLDEVKTMEAVGRAKGFEPETYSIGYDCLPVKVETAETDMTLSVQCQEPKLAWNKPVKCVETGEVFATIKECQKKMGLSYKSLYNALKSGNARDGLHFTYTDEKTPAYVVDRSFAKKRVQCLNTGQIFNSVKEICQTYNISGNSFYYHMRKNEPIEGLSFKYI